MYNDDINNARRTRRKCERKWCKTKHVIDHDVYVDQSKKVNKLIQSAKQTYYRDILETADSKNMFSTLNTLLNKNTRQLLDADKASDLCNSFARFFTQKVTIDKKGT